MSHNPYVGIQRTVFEQGWKRGLREAARNLKLLLAAEFVDESRKIGIQDALHEIEAMLDA